MTDRTHQAADFSPGEPVADTYMPQESADPWPDVNLNVVDAKENVYPAAGLGIDEFNPGGGYWQTAHVEGEATIAHLIGERGANVPSLPHFDIEIPEPVKIAERLHGVRVSRRNFSLTDKLSLIDEDGAASNTQKLDLEGTHYVSEEMFLGL